MARAAEQAWSAIAGSLTLILVVSSPGETNEFFCRCLNFMALLGAKQEVSEIIDLAKKKKASGVIDVESSLNSGAVKRKTIDEVKIFDVGEVACNIQKYTH